MKKIIVLLLWTLYSTVYAQSLGEYTQYNNGNLRGHIQVYGIAGISGDALIEIQSDVRVEFELTKDEDILTIHINNQPIEKNINYALIAKLGSAELDKTFTAKGKAPAPVAVVNNVSFTENGLITGQVIDVTPAAPKQTNQEQNQDLAINKIEYGGTTPSTALEITIEKDIGTARVRDILKEFELNYGYRLVELDGDAKLLNMFINKNVPVRKYKDLTPATNGAIKTIYFDQRKKTVRVTDHNRPALTAKTKSPPPPRPAQTTRTLRELFSDYIKEKYDMKLIEGERDNRLLDMKIQLKTLKNLEQLTDYGIKRENIIFDRKIKQARILP